MNINKIKKVLKVTGKSAATFTSTIAGQTLGICLMSVGLTAANQGRVEKQTGLILRGLGLAGAGALTVAGTIYASSCAAADIADDMFEDDEGETPDVLEPWANVH